MDRSQFLAKNRELLRQVDLLEAERDRRVAEVITEYNRKIDEITDQLLQLRATEQVQVVATPAPVGPSTVPSRAAEVEATTRAAATRTGMAVLARVIDTTAAEILKRRRAPMQEKVATFIKQNPVADYDALTRGLYGFISDDSRAAARTLVFKMKSTGVLIGEPGQWKIVHWPGQDPEGATT